ncbi:hypothetical protein GNI_007330 [Gregarina niphandrodes]|uniref:Uncharacterized protein n=1 Tax=Gregarina niphandrodes TaxID=110365 RepID=A0A023BD26_GRENI|nr:hypothetical protein GNI_007330 [Gregarina niphandrodes]EZG87277.1 hypothetical protein GNI_007330 [Gregarina niphandrodes]|eukprot:XP_011128673.1 hypothetical protein GNI_007330 [Gregarina niphandrodes]
MSDSSSAPNEQKVMLEFHRTVLSLWSDLILRYYMGAEMKKGLIFQADGSASCLTMRALDGMGCDLLNISCENPAGTSQDPVCELNFESACHCPTMMKPFLTKYLRVPPIYSCSTRLVTPRLLIKTILDSGYDLQDDFQTFMQDFNLNELEVVNPLLIRPENYVAPRYHISLLDLLGLTNTNPAVLAVQIPVGQCTLNTYFFTGDTFTAAEAEPVNIEVKKLKGAVLVHEHYTVIPSTHLFLLRHHEFVTDRARLHKILLSNEKFSPVLNGGDRLVSGERQVAGVERQVVGVERQVVGVERQVVGVERQVVGGERQVVGGERQVVGGERQTSGSSRQVSSSRRVSGGSRQVSGGSRQVSGGSRQVSGDRQISGNIYDPDATLLIQFEDDLASLSSSATESTSVYDQRVLWAVTTDRQAEGVGGYESVSRRHWEDSGTTEQIKLSMMRPIPLGYLAPLSPASVRVSVAVAVQIARALDKYLRYGGFWKGTYSAVQVKWPNDLVCCNSTHVPPGRVSRPRGLLSSTSSLPAANAPGPGPGASGSGSSPATSSGSSPATSSGSGCQGRLIETYKKLGGVIADPVPYGTSSLVIDPSNELHTVSLMDKTMDTRAQAYECYMCISTGLNVNSVPEGLRSIACCLKDLTSVPLDLQEIQNAVVAALVEPMNLADLQSWAETQKAWAFKNRRITCYDEKHSIIDQGLLLNIDLCAGQLVLDHGVVQPRSVAIID